MFKNKEKLLWNIFYFILLLSAIQVIGALMGIQLDKSYPLFKLIFLGIPVILVILHSFITLSPFRGTFFLLLAATIGFTSEYLGLKYGQFFGTFYTYKQQLTLFTVPLQVLFYWAVFIYTGYCITNSFLIWLRLKKPIQKFKNRWLFVLTILLDGFFVLAIDLFMDPLEVKQGTWTWINGGPYFGVPIGNFIGWFIVAVLSSGIFRSFEYLFPKKEEKFDKTIFIIPVLCYGLVALSLLGMAIQFQMYELGVLGSVFMIPTVLFNLFLFNRYRSK